VMQVAECRVGERAESAHAFIRLERATGGGGRQRARAGARRLGTPAIPLQRSECVNWPLCACSLLSSPPACLVRTPAQRAPPDVLQKKRPLHRCTAQDRQKCGDGCPASCASFRRPCRGSYLTVIRRHHEVVANFACPVDWSALSRPRFRNSLPSLAAMCGASATAPLYLRSLGRMPQPGLRSPLLVPVDARETRRLNETEQMPIFVPASHAVCSCVALRVPSVVTTASECSISRVSIHGDWHQAFHPAARRPR